MVRAVNLEFKANIKASMKTEVGGQEGVMRCHY